MARVPELAAQSDRGPHLIGAPHGRETPALSITGDCARHRHRGQRRVGFLHRDRDRCARRIGLLYDITRTLSELELAAHLAKVAAYTDRVIDAFYVRDELGSKVTDADRVARIERAMGALLE